MLGVLYLIRVRLVVIEIVLKPYEIARNNRQTTYQSKLLQKTVQPNSTYLLSYNDLFVFALMHLICVTGD